jgi:hypothetical protein
VADINVSANANEPRTIEVAGGPFIQSVLTGEGVTVREVAVAMPSEGLPWHPAGSGPGS